MADEKEDPQSRRPEDSAFKQQRLKAWQPLLTPPWVIGTFFVTGAVFLIIGGVVLQASRSVVEVEVRYDNQCVFKHNCTLSVQIPSDMSPPIFFYYKLTNFYQNHRRYVKSRDDNQLSGSVVSNPTNCDPLTNFNNSVLYPCGLIANSFFNDTFSASVIRASDKNRTLNVLPWTDLDIAWASDKSKKFHTRATQPWETKFGPGGFSLPAPSEEEFIVWMRTAGLPTFRKLNRRIPDYPLYQNDTVIFNITDAFPVDQFNGQKFLVLSTTSWMGGKNDFLGIAYLVVGAICLFLAGIFLLKQLMCPRAMGDTSYLDWPAITQRSSNAPQRQVDK